MSGLFGGGSSSSGSNNNYFSNFGQSSQRGLTGISGTSTQQGRGTSGTQSATTGTTTTSGTGSGTSIGSERGTSSTSSTSTESSAFGQLLGQISQQGLSELSPLTQTFISQLQSILGGNEFTGGAIPLVAAAASDARAAGGQAIAADQQALGRSGAGQGAFANNVLSQAGMSEAEAVGGAGNNVAVAMEAQVPGFLQSMTTAGYSGLAGAAATNNTTSTSSTTSFSDITRNAFNSIFGQSQNTAQQSSSLSSYLNSLNSQNNQVVASNQQGQQNNRGVGGGTSNSSTSSSPGLGDILLAGLTSWLAG